MTCEIVEFSQIDEQMRSDAGTAYTCLALRDPARSCSSLLPRSIEASTILLSVHQPIPVGVSPSRTLARISISMPLLLSLDTLLDLLDFSLDKPLKSLHAVPAYAGRSGSRF
jgi:hypothetical protein